MSGGGGRPDLDAAILHNLLVQTTRAYDRQLEELERQRRLAEVTLASIADGVVVTDPSGRVRTLNAAAERLTGWSREEAESRPVAEVLRLAAEHEGPGEVQETDPLSLAREGGVIEDVSLARRDGRRVPVRASVAPILEPRGGVLGHVIVFQDVSERRLLALQLAHHATRDPVTGLVNRAELGRRLRETLAARGEATHALCYMDLDRFRLVNEAAGHAAGDRLLRDVADLLRFTFRDGDVVARVGSDEFAVLVHDCTPAAAVALCRRALELVREHRVHWGASVIGVTASCGVVPVAGGAASAEDLLGEADAACCAAQRGGGDRVLLYDVDSLEIRRRENEVRWVVELNRAMEEARLRVHAQRIVPAAGGDRGVRFEALVRLLDREGSLHTAGEFVPAAERFGLIRELDRWVLGAVAAAVRRAPAGVREAIEWVGVNVSAPTLLWDRFPELAAEAVRESGLEPGQVCFEVTESGAVEELDRVVAVMGRMRAGGFRFALDDFGAGMASYGSLRDLPVDVLKIDRRFVQDLVTSSLDRAMVRSVTEIARLLGLVTVAEGVPGRGAAEVALGLGVDFLQGYWCHRPEPLERVLAEGRDA